MTSKQCIKRIVGNILYNCQDFPEGQDNYCKRQNNRLVIRQLNQFVARFGVYALNESVFTWVPNQGNTEITLLEAAIVMRDPALVNAILALGASPCVTTSGVPLITQLLEGRQIDNRYGLVDEDNEIIDILLYYNAEYCPNNNPYYRNRSRGGPYSQSLQATETAQELNEELGGGGSRDATFSERRLNQGPYEY